MAYSRLGLAWLPVIVFPLFLLVLMICIRGQEPVAFRKLQQEEVPQASTAIDPAAEARFENIFKTNKWASAESKSGPGSEVHTTKHVRSWLGDFIERYSIKTFMDLPCGDANWQGFIPGLEKVQYYGFDISSGTLGRAMKKNRDRPWMHFAKFDLGSAVPMRADVHMLKDVVQHWPLSFGLAALRNAKASGTQYLLATNYPRSTKNTGVEFGGYYQNNLALAPFYFPPPIEHTNQFLGDRKWGSLGAEMTLYDLQAWSGGE